MCVCMVNIILNNYPYIIFTGAGESGKSTIVKQMK